MTELIARLFRRITPLQAALNELEEAKLELLKLESVADYANNMVRYHEQRIARLKKRIAEFKEDIA
jgi:predicted  nucleic acid-binding Zn-ribbon protein